MTSFRVFYAWDEKLIEECNRLPAVVGRAKLIHNLIEAYGLVSHLKIVRSVPATFEDLKLCHSDIYLNHLQSMTNVDDEYTTNEEDEKHGIGYDCPPISNMYDCIATIAGGSLTAAKCLMLDLADVSINWCGGWHHAKRFGAEGFCYVNDIVVAIEKLRKKFKKVLYIDLDVHHGNGVQDAYMASQSVFTLSVHKYEPGFYPGTGGLDDIGTDVGKGYSCNIPLHESYTDVIFEMVFKKVFSLVFKHFLPDAIVVQCGADALANDPHGGARLTARGYCECIMDVVNKRKPTLLLGGGGYNHPNTARLWTSITASLVNVDLEDPIPEHNDWPRYGPDFMLHIQPTLARDANKIEYIEEVINKIQGNLLKYLGSEKKIVEESKKHKLNADVLNAKKQKVSSQKKTECEKPRNFDIYEFVE